MFSTTLSKRIRQLSKKSLFISPSSLSLLLLLLIPMRNFRSRNDSDLEIVDSSRGCQMFQKQHFGFDRSSTSTTSSLTLTLTSTLMRLLLSYIRWRQKQSRCSTPGFDGKRFARENFEIINLSREIMCIETKRSISIKFSKFQYIWGASVLIFS